MGHLKAGALTVGLDSRLTPCPGAEPGKGPLEWWESRQLKVGHVVDEIDPEGLLAMGAPPGEHAKEIDRLASLVVRDDVSEQSVLAVWERAYGPESALFRRPDMLTSLTQQLL